MPKGVRKQKQKAEVKVDPKVDLSEITPEDSHSSEEAKPRKGDEAADVAEQLRKFKQWLESEIAGSDSDSESDSAPKKKAKAKAKAEAFEDPDTTQEKKKRKYTFKNRKPSQTGKQHQIHENMIPPGVHAVQPQQSQDKLTSTMRVGVRF